MTIASRLRALSAALIFNAIVSTPAHAHPIHTTLTVITVSDMVLNISVRAFADDFAASVATFAGKTVPKDSSVVEGDVRRYVAANVRLNDGNGREINAEFCGVRRAGELYWLCLRAPLSGRREELRFVNKLLTERHDDQINIVRVENRKERTTALLNRENVSALIPLHGLRSPGRR